MKENLLDQKGICYQQKILPMVFFFIILFSLAYPVKALESGSKIHTEESVFETGKLYELFQGYSFRIIELSPSGNKIHIEILLDGKSKDDSIYINKKNAYQYTIDYDNETYLILSILLEKIYIDDRTAKISITQYIDPSRSTSEFLIFDKEYTLTQSELFSLKQDYSLKLEEMDSDCAILELNKHEIKVKEHEMEIGDTFDYTVTVDGRENPVITFELETIFIGTTRKVVKIRHLYQFKEPLDLDPAKTATSVIEDIKSGIEEYTEIINTNINTNINTHNLSPTYTPEIEDNKLSESGSILAIIVFIATVILTIIWADKISKQKKK